VLAVYLRERPDTLSRAVTTLGEGEQVEIQGVVNGWALVQTEKAETGYVRVGYIAAPQDALARLQNTKGSEQPTQHPTDSPPAPETAGEANQDPETELITLRGQLEELRRQATLAADNPGERILQEIRRDLRTLLEQTSSMDRRLASSPSGGDRPVPVLANPAFPWTLVGIALFVGMLLGLAIGRRQERNRRTRIRI